MTKKIFCFFAVLLFASCGSDKASSLFPDSSRISASSPKVTLQTVLSNMEKGKYRQGELLVKFKSGIDASSSVKMHQTVGAKTIKKFSVVPNLEHVKLPEGLTVKDAIIQYMNDPNVEYAEPNYLWRPAATIPDDKFFDPQQWALRNTGVFASGTAGADIKATDAWDISQGSSSIIIAVIDTGVDYTHADLVGNLWTNPQENPNNGIDDDGNGKIDDWRGWNVISQNNDPFDDVGHGTHVAGIIGAVGNNGTGTAGVMWHVRIMPLKACLVDDCPIDAIVDSIGYAVSKGAKVINASFGGNEFSSPVQDAISEANTAGVLFIAAAGNDDFDLIGNNNDTFPFYPASFPLPNIISVAATDQDDQRASFSNFGLSSVHVAAPGVYILSSVPFTGVDFSFSSLCTGSFFVGYDFCSGTSMATPHVSGLAGLLYSYYTNFTASQIRSTILRYVDVLPTLNGFIQTGGRINAFKALSSLLSPTGLSATALSASEISLSWTDNATGEDGYSIERKTDSGSFAQIITRPPNTTSYTDTGLDANTTYTYRVRAYSYIGASPAFSNEASATTLSATTPPPPSSDGGGGCSIGARQNAPTAVSDLGILLAPLLLMALIRRRK